MRAAARTENSGKDAEMNSECVKCTASLACLTGLAVLKGNAEEVEVYLSYRVESTVTNVVVNTEKETMVVLKGTALERCPRWIGKEREH